MYFSGFVSMPFLFLKMKINYVLVTFSYVLTTFNNVYIQKYQDLFSKKICKKYDFLLNKPTTSRITV